MIQNEYEIITHNNQNFHVFLVNLLYRTPHIHKDFEISLVLNGSLSLVTANGSTQLSAHDIFVMNPFQSHELTAKEPSLILSLQVTPLFFSSYFPQINHIEFEHLLITDKSTSSETAHKLLQLAYTYFQEESFSEIKCSILVNQIFLMLLESESYHIIPEKEKKATQAKGKRIRHIMHYIDEHYTEKLLLSDIAEKEGLDLFYLSHFFKESFGISFQNYLTKIRCEHARQLLLLTDYSLLDISISCGFSDTKYFNKGFQSQYGCSPKEYRNTFHSSQMEVQQQSILTAQEFLSKEASLITLDKYSDDFYSKQIF